MSGQPTGAIFASRPQAPVRRIPDCVGLGPVQFSQVVPPPVVVRNALFESRPIPARPRRDLFPGRNYGIPTPTPPSTLMPATPWFLQRRMDFNYAAMRSQDGQGVNSGIQAFAATIQTVHEAASAVDVVTVTGVFQNTVTEAASAVDTVGVVQATSQTVNEAASAVEVVTVSQATSQTVSDALSALSVQNANATYLSTLTEAASASDTQSNTSAEPVTIADALTPVDSQTSSITVPLRETANAIDVPSTTQNFAVAVPEAAVAADTVQGFIAFSASWSDALTALDVVSVSKGTSNPITDALVAADIVFGETRTPGFIYSNAFAWEPPTRPTFTLIAPGQPPMQTMILEKRIFDARPYDAICKDLLVPGATIANVNAVLVDQGGLVFGTPIINTQQNIYPDGTIAPIGTVIQVYISGGVIPPLLSQLMCTIRIQFTDTFGSSIEATVLLLLINEVSAN